MKTLNTLNTSQLVAAFRIPVFTIAKIATEPGWQSKLKDMVNGFLTNPSNEAIGTKYPGTEVVIVVAGLLAVAFLVLTEKERSRKKIH